MAVPDFAYWQDTEAPACQECDAAGDACVTCYEGAGVSASTGACVKCTDPNATDCDGDEPSMSKACFYWYGASNATGECVQCSQTDDEGSPMCAKCDG